MHDLGRSYLLREDLANLAQFDWGYGVSAVMPQSLRDDYWCIVDSDDLPTDAQLAELQHTFAQRLAEFEASGWSDSAPQPGLSRSAPPVLAPWPSALPASSTLWRPGCSQSG